MALAQTDIKRILAYSTVSQLGFMMVALGTGGVAAAMFHLIAHAFFKALLFLSAGSVIHGCHEEQDIRRMGGLRAAMPKTFVTYAVGMMALSGFPFVFSGFWSKEAILHSARIWPGGYGPFLLAAGAALLTAFYMTRQALLVFFGAPRKPGVHHPHESPSVMLVPLYVLAAGAVLLSLVGTPVWPWFEEWIHGETGDTSMPAALMKPEALKLHRLVAGHRHPRRRRVMGRSIGMFPATATRPIRWRANSAASGVSSSRRWASTRFTKKPSSARWRFSRVPSTRSSARFSCR